MGFLYLCFKEALNLIGGGNSTREKPFILDAFYPTHIFSSPEDACLRKLQSSRISLLLPQIQANRFQFEFRLPRKDGCITSEMEWRRSHGIHDPIRDPRPYVHCMHCTLTLGVQQMSLACFIRSPSCRHLNQSITTIKVRERGGGKVGKTGIAARHSPGFANN